MGYSCRADASDTYHEWERYCNTTTEMSNVYKVGATTYCLEMGREQRDGAITGTTLRLEGERGNWQGYPCGSWRIDPDGTVKRYPTGMKKALGK
jgi:hypothetical protein